MPTEERLRRATSVGLVGVWEWNLEAQTLFVDPVVKHILGYGDEEIPNEIDAWMRLIHPDDLDMVNELIEAQLAGETDRYQIEYRMLHRDGSVRWFLVTGSTTRDESGRTISMAGTTTDITALKLQEDALRQAKELNDRIVESSNDCIKIFDLDGKLQHINRAGLRLLGIEDASILLNRSLTELYQGDSSREAAAALDAARNGETGRFHGFSRSPSGMAQWWDVVVTPINGADGKAAQLLAISRDITEPHRDEQFREAEHRMLEMIARGSELTDVLSVLVQLMEQHSDGTLCSVLLLDKDNLTVRHGAAPSLPPDYVQAIDGMPIGASAGSCGTAMYTGETVIVTDIDNDPLWADYLDIASQFDLKACWSTPIFSAEREILGSFAMYSLEPRAPSEEELQLVESAAYYARVAIERHRAQQALRQSEARNRAMLRAIPDWVFLLTADGVFLDYHAKDPSKLYADPSAIIGSHVEEVLPQPLAGRLMESFQRVLASDVSDKVEYSIPNNNSEEFFEATIVRCDDDNLLSIVRNVTQQKQAEVEAATQQRELRHLGRVAVLGELTGALAHELSQPLTAMRTNAAAARLMMDASPLPAGEIREALDDIIDNNRRAGSVVNRLRALLRKEDLNLQQLDLNELVQEVVDLAHSEILSRHVTVKQELAPVELLVSGDRIQLQQVILNLVMNACDAMSEVPADKRELSIVTDTDDEFVCLAVTDHGTGIPEEQLEKVFEPFVTFRKKGLGLGLAISRSIIKAHHGTISAANNPKGGAAFRCFLPAARKFEDRRVG